MNFSEEIIEIGDKEYKLFINRNGIIAWEKITNLKEFKELIEKKYIKNGETNKIDEPLNININELPDDFDPFSVAVSTETLDEDEAKLHESMKVFYWMALKKHNEIGKTEAFELYEQAIKDYGLEQMVQLMVQMINAINENSLPTGGLKNLKALKPAK